MPTSNHYGNLYVFYCIRASVHKNCTYHKSDAIENRFGKMMTLAIKTKGSLVKLFMYTSYPRKRSGAFLTQYLCAQEIKERKLKDSSI